MRMKQRYVIRTGLVLMAWAAIAALVYISGNEMSDLIHLDLPLASLGVILVGIGYLVFRNDAVALERHKPMMQPNHRPSPSRTPQESRYIFISYRRGDSADITGRIYDRLAAHFGKGTVFKDVDSIPLGIDFRKHLEEAVSRSNILLAIIGKRWLDPGMSPGSEGSTTPETI